MSDSDTVVCLDWWCVACACGYCRYPCPCVAVACRSRVGDGPGALRSARRETGDTPPARRRRGWTSGVWRHGEGDLHLGEDGGGAEMMYNSTVY